MQLAILNNNYPSETNLYGDVFVHSRLKYYLPFFQIKVFGYIPDLEQKQEFTYENIEVINFNDKASYLQALKNFNPNVIGIHFAEGWLYEAFIKNTKIPVVIWVHGAEALGWYRRLYNLKGVKQALGAIKANMVQLTQMRQIIKHSNKTGQITFVFVSEWMRKIAETDTATKIKNYKIIPNPIDTDLFAYQERSPEQRKRILLIRSFESKKYANDIAVNAILLLSKAPFFDDLEFHIYGKGKFFKQLTDPIKDFSNVTLNNFFIENKNIPGIHRDFGIFLCPTRQDAQGVSMCEAMAGGLVVISSDSTAIPEFVTDRESGFLTRSSEDIKQAISTLYNDPKLFLSISENAALSIRQKAGHNYVIESEIEILRQNLSL